MRKTNQLILGASALALMAGAPSALAQETGEDTLRQSTVVVTVLSSLVHLKTRRCRLTFCQRMT